MGVSPTAHAGKTTRLGIDHGFVREAEIVRQREKAEAKTKIAVERRFRPEHQRAGAGVHAVRADHEIEPAAAPRF